MAGDAVIAAGFGFRASASAESFADALERAGGGESVTLAATIADKAGDPALVDFTGSIGLTMSAIAPEVMKAQETLTRSAASIKAHGVGSVAEAAALAAAGPGARLIAPRAISEDGMATCALAQKEKR